MNTRLVLFASIVGAATIAAAPVNAQQQRLSEECRSEVQTLCDTQDRRERRACMREKFSELSEGCQTAITELRAALEERRANGEGRPPRRDNAPGDTEG